MSPKFKINLGILKGKTIFFQNKNNLRPTKNNLRIVFFSWIINNVGNLYFLDLFSGSGIIGFELFSKNAKKIIMLERDHVVYSTININKNHIRTNTNNLMLYCVNSYCWLNSFNFLNISLIFFDPPYNFIFTDKYIHLLKKVIFLRKVTFIFIENDDKYFLRNMPLDWFLFKKEYHGISYVYLFKKI